MNSVETPSNVLVVWRGMRRRCGRCGTRAPFTRWFRLAERCPTCGYKFAREEGFLTGVYLVNYTVVAVALVAVIFVYLGVVVVTGESQALWPYLLAGGVVAVVLPIAGYPFAATTWAAIDLAMRPLDPIEEAEAATFAAGASPGPESPA